MSVSRATLFHGECAACRITHYRLAARCKTLSSIFLMLPQYSGPALGLPIAAWCHSRRRHNWRISRCQRRNLARHHRRRTARGDAVFSSNGSARHPCVANVQQATESSVSAHQRWLSMANCSLTPLRAGSGGAKSACQPVTGQS